MQDRKQVQIFRYIFIILFLLLVCVFFCVRLVSLQILNRYIEEDSGSIKTYTRTEVITAARGEIFDRNGKALVTNEYSRSVIIDYGDLPWKADEVNELILSTVKACAAADGEDAVSSVEHFPFEDVWGNVAYKQSYLSGGEDCFRLDKMLARFEKAVDEPASDFLSYLLKRWSIADAEGNLRYSREDAYILLTRRYDMEDKQFGPTVPYVVCENASIKAISAVFELNLRGVKTQIEQKRVYEYPGYMSHILGRTSKIPAEQYEFYQSLGYPMDATVGTSGVELAFEKYLRGIDGEITIVEDMDGNILEKHISREPVAGGDVYLTIDLDLQIVAEDSLAYRVQKIAADGLAAGGGASSGADANAGAVVALDPKTGGVLCMASYPTYDLSIFDITYQELAGDKNAPLLNRALSASYAPGSTFKLCTGLAALEMGKITADQKIKDLGVYEYYEDYQPHCWIYDMAHTTHGSINVEGAIEHSCNYFFYDVGRQLGIDNITRYASALGLGQSTGIELEETVGILAGPEYTQTNGIGAWNPGDTLGAAIGQSYHLFTPMQLSSYLSAIVNYGTRYKAHLLLGVYDFASGEQIYAYEPVVMEGSIELSEKNVDTITAGMRRVMNQNLTKRAFADLVAVQAVGKTGTAQIGAEKSDNAVFVSFAPYGEDVSAEIVIAGIIERGVSGNNTAYVISDIMEKYFQGEANIG